jgi:hypothetical protein
MLLIEDLFTEPLEHIENWMPEDMQYVLSSKPSDIRDEFLLKYYLVAYCITSNMKYQRYRNYFAKFAFFLTTFFSCISRFLLTFHH